MPPACRRLACILEPNRQWRCDAVLAAARVPDLAPAFPHITLGTADPATAKLASDRLNTPGIEIPGRVDTVTVAAMDGGELRHLAEFPLGASPGTMA